MSCHCQGIAVPLSLFLRYRDDAGLLVVDVVALELVKGHRNGCINFVLHTRKTFKSLNSKL